jgi:hypothetical protein
MKAGNKYFESVAKVIYFGTNFTIPNSFTKKLRAD